MAGDFSMDSFLNVYSLGYISSQKHTGPIETEKKYAKDKKKMCVLSSSTRKKQPANGDYGTRPRLHYNP